MTGCQCEHVRHAGSVCYRPAGKARSDYIGSVCDTCADRHASEYLIVDTSGRITAYGRRVLLSLNFDDITEALRAAVASRIAFHDQARRDG